MSDFSAFCALVARTEAPPWIVRLDLPGFGSSPVPERPMGSREYAVMVEEAIAQVVAEMPEPHAARIIVIGHSFGGRVALYLSALDQGELDLAGLVLTGVPLLRTPEFVRKPKLKFRAGRFLFRYRMISEGRMERLRSRYGSTDYRNAVGVMREVFVRVVNEDYAEMLRGLKIPVNLLWGIDDATAPLKVAEQSVLLCPEKIQLNKVPGNHFLAITSPGVLLDSVLDLVRRTSN
jgi:pimeloyl-ACP methyl ester carboxylesterase